MQSNFFYTITKATLYKAIGCCDASIFASLDVDLNLYRFIGYSF